LFDRSGTKELVMSAELDAEPSWVEPTHRALAVAGVTLVGHVPDGGLRHLIVRLEADPRFTVVRLTSEEEGIALAAGGWLGGARTAVLMQSSGVGNCTNMLSLLNSCAIPAVVMVTMRGQEGETNPWQVPMGAAAGSTMQIMGVDVRSVGSADGVAAEVTRACADAFDGHAGAAGVLVEQRVIGAKKFAGDGR
jgi:sulfopyruvate decarboxylase TPP-binding subunit